MTTLTALQSEMEKLQAKIASLQEQEENKPETWRDQARPEVRAIADTYNVKQLQQLVNDAGVPFNVIYQTRDKWQPALNNPNSKHHAICVRVKEAMETDGVDPLMRHARLAYAYYLLTTGKSGKTAKTAKTGNGKPKVAEPAKVAEPVPTLAELQATRATLAKMGMDTTAIDLKIASLQAVDEETETETAVNPIVALATLRAERDAIAATAKTGNPDVDRFLAHRFGGDYWTRVANGQQDPSAHFVSLAGKWANGEASDDEAIYEIKPAKTEPTTTTTETEPATTANVEKGNGRYASFLAYLPTLAQYAAKHGKLPDGFADDIRYTGDRSSIRVNKDKKLVASQKWHNGENGSREHKNGGAKNNADYIRQYVSVG